MFEFSYFVVLWFKEKQNRKFKSMSSKQLKGITLFVNTLFNKYQMKKKIVNNCLI